jgi:peptidoglycan hydrolase-like protein with peptidoglycan-binding domain
MSRQRGRRLWVATLTLIVAVAAVIGVAITVTQTTAQETTETEPPTTASVTRQTLRVVEELGGQLGHGTPQPIAPREQGTLVRTAASGSTVERGEPLFVVDDRPTTLLYGELPLWRPLAEGVSGDDVAQLEENLDALGYGDGLTVDTEFDAATTDAVLAWQEAIGVAVDGVVDLGEVVYLTGPAWIAAESQPVGSAVQPGAAILEVSGTDRVVSADLPANLRSDVAVDDVVEVELPDGTIVEGTVTEIAGAIEANPQTGEETVALTVELAAEQADATSDGPVTVRIVRQERADVLAVPVQALLALLEGGYALEVVEDDGSISLRPVDVGLFADGWVEITGDVSEGEAVVVP